MLNKFIFDKCISIILNMRTFFKYFLENNLVYFVLLYCLFIFMFNYDSL